MPVVDEEILRGQREAEQRVRRMREENRRLAQQMGACSPEERMPTPPGSTAPPRSSVDMERLLPLLLAAMIYRDDGPIELVLALLYLAI